MATLYASTPLLSSQALPLAAPQSILKAEFTEILKASRELASAQITFNDSLWSCASCAATHTDRNSVTHSPACAAGRVLEAFGAIRRFAAGRREWPQAS
jgi:hypothetical protein